MSLYGRQELIEGINNNIKVCVVGAGGIGFHVAKLLAMSGVEDLFVHCSEIKIEHYPSLNEGQTKRSNMRLSLLISCWFKPVPTKPGERSNIW